ncbi:MAG TPA: glycosyltransferase [Candidatus Angelobacter sp.]|nr:glycosyltransferase [Candidatus Angelobacter sp.]
MIHESSTPASAIGTVVPTINHSQDQPFVSVAIITLNSRSTIQKCLEALINLEYPRQRYEIVIVDGGSTDGTTELLKEFPVRVVVDRQRNRGTARNIAIDNCGGQIIAFTDADCVPLKSWLTDHVLIHQDPHVLVVAGSVLQGGDFGLPTTFYHETYFATQSPHTARRKTWEIASANASFKTSTFKVVGHFPLLDRGEESLLAWKVIRAGFDVIFDPTPKVVHLHRAMSYRSLFQRSWDEGYSDRCLQSAFGEASPFRLPEGFGPTLMFSLPLLIARAGRYFVKLLIGGFKNIHTLISIPILIAASLWWVRGYLAAARNGGLQSAAL